MRERIITNHERKKIICFELLFPEDFILTVAPTIVFNRNLTEFTAGDLINEDLKRLREAQLSDNSIEHGLLRIMHRGKFYMVKTTLRGSVSGFTFQIGYDVWSEEAYHSKLVFEEWPPTPIVDVSTDLYHTHPYARNDDPNISGLFSSEDIISMGKLKAKRFWVIGPDGTALCLINYGRIDFTDRPLFSGNESQTGSTYSKTCRNLLERVKTCGFYKSNNLRDFSLVDYN